MNGAVRITAVSLGALVSAACTTSSGYLAPVDERGVIGASGTASTGARGIGPDTGTDAPRPLPDGPSAVQQPLPATGSAAAPVGPAVVALLNTASRQSRAGNHEQAAASLERALNIEPQHAWLWYRLARVRLTQKRYAEAANLAAKSNSLAGANPRLRADNWRLIAEARTGRGDYEGARVAKEAARLLED